MKLSAGTTRRISASIHNDQGNWSIVFSKLTTATNGSVTHNVTHPLPHPTGEGHYRLLGWDGHILKVTEHTSDGNVCNEISMSPQFSEGDKHVEIK